MNTNLAEKLKPHGSSTCGFLGKDETLEEVVERDAKTLDELGITHQEIADRLKALTSGWEDGEQVKPGKRMVEGKYILRNTGWLGYQYCPWGDDEKTSRDWGIENTQNGFRIEFSGLLPHLIEKHKFFEGRGTSYRLDPLETVLALDMQSPNMTHEQIKERLFSDLAADLTSKSRTRNRHALEVLSCVQENPRFSELLIDFIKNFQENLSSDPMESLNIREIIRGLVKLARLLPEKGFDELKNAVTGIYEFLNDENDRHNFQRRDLQKLRRDLDGETHPIEMGGYYWPDWVEYRRSHQGDWVIDQCLEHIGDRDLNTREIALGLSKFRRGEGEAQMIESNITGLTGSGLNRIFRDMVNKKATTREELEAKIEFWSLMADVAALRFTSGDMFRCQRQIAIAQKALAELES